METQYCCVTCGAEADELSHHYNEGVIKIIHCVTEKNPYI
jgi:DNA-directed RNA polymerase subunit RPC12/RpoP